MIKTLKNKDKRKKNITTKKNINSVMTPGTKIRQYKQNNVNYTIPYIPIYAVQIAFLLHTLKSNNIDCGHGLYFDKYLITDKKSNVIYQTIHDEKKISEEDIIESLRNKLKLCFQKKQLFVIPINIIYGKHSNILIFNYHRKEVERFEPHGYKTLEKKMNNNDILNQNIQKFVHKIDSSYTYIPPHKICPFDEKGLQMIDQQYKEIKTIKYKNFEIRDKYGYCLAWSYFFTDLRLKYPHLSGKVLYDKSIKNIGNHPKDFRNFIRGQTKYVIDIINNIDSKYTLEEFIYLYENKLNYSKQNMIIKTWNNYMTDLLKKF